MSFILFYTTKLLHHINNKPQMTKSGFPFWVKTKLFLDSIVQDAVGCFSFDTSAVLHNGGWSLQNIVTIESCEGL